MSKNTVINITQLGAGIEIKQLYSNKTAFSMTMRFNMLNSKSQEPDILDLMAQMTKKESELFIRIKNELNFRTNVAVVDFGELSLSQRNHLSNNLSTLVKMALVKRVTKHTFMINPKYIIPPESHITAVTTAWNGLK